MRVKSLVSLSDELSVKTFLAPARLVSSHKQIALRLGSKAKATRHSPSAALNRSSFIFAWREPWSVSTRSRPNCGPNCSKSSDNARISVCTGSGSASNSGSNSSPISTAHLTVSVWHGIHMIFTTYLCWTSGHWNRQTLRLCTRCSNILDAGNDSAHKNAERAAPSPLRVDLSSIFWASGFQPDADALQLQKDVPARRGKAANSRLVASLAPSV
jgi:hypothetical protein